MTTERARELLVFADCIPDSMRMIENSKLLVMQEIFVALAQSLLSHKLAKKMRSDEIMSIQVSNIELLFNTPMKSTPKVSNNFLTVLKSNAGGFVVKIEEYCKALSDTYRKERQIVENFVDFVYPALLGFFVSSEMQSIGLMYIKKISKYGNLDLTLLFIKSFLFQTIESKNNFRDSIEQSITNGRFEESPFECTVNAIKSCTQLLTAEHIEAFKMLYSIDKAEFAEFVKNDFLIPEMETVLAKFRLDPSSIVIIDTMQSYFVRLFHKSLLSLKFTAFRPPHEYIVMRGRLPVLLPLTGVYALWVIIKSIPNSTSFKFEFPLDLRESTNLVLLETQNMISVKETKNIQRVTLPDLSSVELEQNPGFLRIKNRIESILDRKHFLPFKEDIYDQPQDVLDMFSLPEDFDFEGFQDYCAKSIINTVSKTISGFETTLFISSQILLLDPLKQSAKKYASESILKCLQYRNIKSPPIYAPPCQIIIDHDRAFPNVDTVREQAALTTKNFSPTGQHLAYTSLYMSNRRQAPTKSEFVVKKPTTKTRPRRGSYSKAGETPGKIFNKYLSTKAVHQFTLPYLEFYLNTTKTDSPALLELSSRFYPSFESNAHLPAAIKEMFNSLHLYDSGTRLFRLFHLISLVSELGIPYEKIIQESRGPGLFTAYFWYVITFREIQSISKAFQPALLQKMNKFSDFMRKAISESDSSLAEDVELLITKLTDASL